MKLIDRTSLAVPAIILLLIIIPACNKRPSPELMLYDFNREAELNNLSWSCRTVYSLDRQHAASGFSLRLEMYPDLYPGFKNGRMENDWIGYDFLCLEIFNPGPRPLRLACRLDDRQDNPPYSDRVNCPITLVPGANSVRLDLRALRTSGTGRSLNLSHIYRMFFFLCSPNKKVTLFIDDIRLSKAGDKKNADE